MGLETLAESKDVMAYEEPDYESLPSRIGPPSEEERNERMQQEPHPFWSERYQDEFRLQQIRPRELDLATFDESSGEVLLGLESSVPQEPPYGSEGPDEAHRRREALVREAVEEVLLENESLRRRISDLEVFSSVASTSSRGRRLTSSTGQSGDQRLLEPDYDRLFGPTGIQAPTPQSHARVQEERTGQDVAGPVTTAMSIMERSGSLERWSFLGFPVAATSSEGNDRGFGTSGIQAQGPNAGSVSGAGRRPSHPFAGIDNQHVRTMCVCPGDTNVRPVLRPDPVPRVAQPVARSGSVEGRTESNSRQDVNHGVELDDPRGRDPVFEWFNTVTTPTQGPQSRAGFALFHNPPPGLDPQARTLADHPRPSHYVPVPSFPSRLEGPVSTRRVEGQRVGMSQDLTGLRSEEGRQVGSIGPTTIGNRTQMGGLSSTAGVAGYLNMENEGFAGVPSAAPCLLDSTPPREGQAGMGASQAHSGILRQPSQSARPKVVEHPQRSRGPQRKL